MVPATHFKQFNSRKMMKNTKQKTSNIFSYIAKHVLALQKWVGPSKTPRKDQQYERKSMKVCHFIKNQQYHGFLQRTWWGF